MDPIILSAIKKAKKELEERQQVSAQTLDDLKSALADLKDTKLPGWVQDILTKVDQSTNSTGTTLFQLKSSLESKLSPWTGTRAAKLDNLDAKVSSRADGSYYTPARASKLDQLDATVSSRADGKDWTAERAGKVDLLDVAVSTRASGDMLNVVNQNIGDVTSRDFNTVMGRLGAVLGYGEQVIYDTPGSYTFTVPPGVKKVNVYMTSAGGAGGSCPANPDSYYTNVEIRDADHKNFLDRTLEYKTYPGGGGASGCAAHLVVNVSEAQQISVVVGAGGRPGILKGGSGGATSFDGIVLTGGAGGSPGAADPVDFYQIQPSASLLGEAKAGEVKSSSSAIKESLSGVAGERVTAGHIYASLSEAKLNVGGLYSSSGRGLKVARFTSEKLTPGEAGSGKSHTFNHTLYQPAEVDRAQGGDLPPLTELLKNRGSGGDGGLPQALGSKLYLENLEHGCILDNYSEYGYRANFRFSRSSGTTDLRQGKPGQDGIVVITY